MNALTANRPEISQRRHELFREARHEVYARTDQMFARLMGLQYVAAIVAVLWVSPYTWYGATARVHLHVFATFVLGALLAAPPILLARYRPGRYSTRMVIAACQMLFSALLIHITGGRIETHFHVFGSLAFLSFYRDWRVFVPATLVVSLDHLIRGIYYPLSVFGVADASHWRWFEHAAWVMFCVFFLVRSVWANREEMLQIAGQRARLEHTKLLIESEVRARTLELAGERSRFLSAFENAPIGMAIVTGEGTLLKVNQELCRLLGYPAADLAGRRLQSLVAGDEVHPELCTGSRGEFQVTYANRQGGEVELNCHVSFQAGSEHQPPHFIAQFLDITERVRVARLMKEQEQRTQLAQKLESLGVLAGGIAHELATPIQYIGDNANFLEDLFGSEVSQLLDAYEQAGETAVDTNFLREEMPAALAQIGEGVQRVTTIVRSIKEYAHSREGGGPVDLNELAETTITMARNEWKYIAEVETELAPNLPAVVADRGGLAQVFLNILVNAAHAVEDVYKTSEQKGLIRVTTAPCADGVEVLFRDSGPGVPEAIISRIFDPFFTTKDVGRGTGQGLSISNNIIKAHGGRLEVVSLEEGGSCFRIWLPLALPQAA
ncbi:MAG: PAS domain S-box protein [Candidatus Eremiobacteraeota bacterium]|nr:PAS domain S-box protein [Candidatus Eremiobacteraeota bacterium]